MLKLRVLSGVTGAVLLIGVLLAPPVVVTIVAIVASLLAILEYRQAARSVSRNVDPLTAVTMTVLLIGNTMFGNALIMKEIGSHIEQWPERFIPIGQTLAMLSGFIFSAPSLRVATFACIVWLFGRLVFQHGSFKLDDLAMTLTGVLYIPFLMSFVTQVRVMEYGEFLIWCVLVGSVLTDTAAYFFGITFGKHKLLPLVSPKKTVEGAIGGVAGSMFAMLALWYFLPIDFQNEIHWAHFLLLGFICGIVSQLGDWSASAIKRGAGIKDFGKLIPGHGGMLDRIDSILFVGPVVYLYFTALAERVQ